MSGLPAHQSKSDLSDGTVGAVPFVHLHSKIEIETTEQNTTNYIILWFTCLIRKE
jgi:hypothetical protein